MLEGWEWIVIGIVAIVIIMWGPAKIPELAKALGKAKGEYKKASKELSDASKKVETDPPETSKTKDDTLIKTAKNLGIETEGITRAQISEEIAAKAKHLGND